MSRHKIAASKNKDHGNGGDGRKHAGQVQKTSSSRSTTNVLLDMSGG